MNAHDPIPEQFNALWIAEFAILAHQTGYPDLRDQTMDFLRKLADTNEEALEAFQFACDELVNLEGDDPAEAL